MEGYNVHKAGGGRCAHANDGTTVRTVERPGLGSTESQAGAREARLHSMLAKAKAAGQGAEST